jgi:predicted ATPase
MSPASLPPAPAQASQSEPEFFLEGYDVKGILGRGGFGVVYRAERRQDALSVAIKVASREQRGAAERLVPEAEALLGVGPPFVPAVYDRGAHGADHYLVLELIQAPTLADLLAQAAGPIRPADFWVYAERILGAVDAVHARGYVHCDLKPENIFLDDSRARLIDFGAVRNTQSPHAPGQKDEAALGTAEYMAPEQCEARLDIDSRADIYALGIVLYEMLAGAPPFWGNAGEVREAQISRRPPRLTNRTFVNPELDGVVLQCLAKDPRQRLASASALRSALSRAFTSGEQRGTGVQTGAPAFGVSKKTEAPARPRGVREKRAVGLLFFESSAGILQITQAVTGFGGQLAHASGSQYVGVFGHDLADNPTRSALMAAQRMLECKLCVRVLLDVALVSIQVRPDGERRFVSTLFSRKERYPLVSDPEGILLTESAKEVVPDVTANPLAIRAGIFCLDLKNESEATTFGTQGARLVGRENVLDRIAQSVLRSVDSATPSILTIIGEPGYGKTLIASTLVQRLRSFVPDAQILKLIGQESPGSATHPTLRDLLRRLLAPPEAAPADYGEAFLSEQIGASLGPQGWAAAALVLGWAPADLPQVRHLSAAPGALRSAALRAAGEALRQAARSRPIVVVLDDAHLADDAALDALEYATLKENEARIAICVLTRPGLERARPTWGNRAAHTDTIVLAPLDPDSAALLARQLLQPVEYVPEAAIRKLVDRTQGIPRLMVELVRGLKRSGLVRRFEHGSGSYLATDELERLPDLPVVQWITAREIEALPAQLAGHARLAAVFGGRFSIVDLDSMLRILERDGAFTETQLDAAIGVRRLLDMGLLIRGALGQIDFRHALLRETLYEAIPEALRKSIHHAAFEMYRDTPLPEEERRPRLAWHAERSGLREEAAATYLMLAEHAQHRHVYLDAELMYTRALANLSESDDLRLSIAVQGRGLMRFRLGRFEGAMQDFAVARERAGKLRDVDRELGLLLDEAMVLDWIGDYAQSAELARTAESRVGPESSELVRARLLMALGRTLNRAGQFEESVRQNREAARRAAQLGDAGYETFVIALLVAGNASGTLGRFDEAEELFGNAIQTAEVRGDVIHVAAALINRGVVWWGRRDADNLIRDLQRVREIARQTGFSPLEYHAAVNLAEVYYSVGDVATAHEHVQRAIQISEHLWGDSWQIFHAELLLARLTLYAEDSGAARALLERILERKWRAGHAGQKDAQLLPTDELLAEMLDIATRSASEAEWVALGERCKAMAAHQEFIEVLETKGLEAMRQGQFERARQALTEALQIAATSPGLLMTRVSRQLKRLRQSMPPS